MNVAIQDTYNLGWKLGSVITGDLDPLVLETYGVERYPVAKELMELDARLVHAYEEGESCKASRIEEIREQYAGFMAGVDVAYPSSIVVAKEDTTTSDYSPFARKLKLGMRIPSFPVIYHCDGTTVHLAQRLTCTGMWRLLVFPGDITQPSRRDTLAGFSDAFSKNQQHWLAATSAQSSSEQRFPCLEPILVHSSRRHAVSLLDLPDIFHPFDDALGWDYWRVFSDRTPQGSESGLACETYGMDKNGPGCLVLCRPDQHVAWAGGLGDAHALNEYLSGLCRGRG